MNFFQKLPTYPRTKRLEKINRLAVKYFCTCLQQSKKAQAYLQKRIPETIIKKYAVGYAPPEGFPDYLNKHDISDHHLRELGLLNFDYEGYAEEYFKHRIMVPIIHAGWVVGFGGRSLGDAMPKYLNSRASVLYNKSAVLYGLHDARKSIVRKNRAILVEGYFDKLSMAANKVKNVVATCGTAFTPAHAALLKRYTDRVYPMMDPDTAGREAAKRAKKVLKKAGIFGGIILLPEGSDPDDYLTQHGPKALKWLDIKK